MQLCDIQTPPFLTKSALDTLFWPPCGIRQITTQLLLLLGCLETFRVLNRYPQQLLWSTLVLSVRVPLLIFRHGRQQQKLIVQEEAEKTITIPQRQIPLHLLL
jgi:hypothetical protein